MFDLITFRTLFALLEARFTEQRDELNALDHAAGDGDHGHTMARAMRAAALASGGQFASLGEGFDAVAAAVAENAGGAIGPILAAFFAEGAVAFVNLQRAGVGEFQRFFKGGLEAVQQVGEAKPGDKTLVDALAPAAEALDAFQGQDLDQALEAAAGAAKQGAHETSQLVASHGRARFVGERSRGSIDAGAFSFALIAQGFVDALHSEALTAASEQAAEEPVPPNGKFINRPEDMVREDLLGLSLAYPKLVRVTDSGILVRATAKPQGRVGIAMGQGGGHTPGMAGFVGKGLLDADALGPVFTCASGVRIFEAIQEADQGAGVVMLVSHHSGDVLNARLARRRAEQAGIQTEWVLSSDDIATAGREEYEQRRGIAGIIFPMKIGGGAAEAGLPLADVAELMHAANQRTASLSVAIRPPSHPATGEALFVLTEGEIEIGTGVHGEVGVYKGKHMFAGQVVDKLLDELLPDLDGLLESKVLMLLNGAGGTSQMELDILYQDTYRKLQAQGLEVAGGVVGSYVTTQEMGGFSLSLCAVTEELLPYWNAPASSPSFVWPRD